MSAPTDPRAPDPRSPRLPPERFYWAILDTSALPPRGRRRHTSLGYLFESFIPVPIETVQSTYISLDDRRVLACGMDRQALIDAASSGALTLAPAALPPFLEQSAGSPVDPASLNLLVGPCEPAPIRRSRRRVALAASAAILACALPLACGQLRRASHDTRAADALERATDALYDQVLPPSTAAAPPAARLTAELRSLDRTRAGHTAPRAPREIAPTLATLLASWPADLHLTTDSLVASPGAISLLVRVPDEAAAERLERELKPPQGWRLGQPDVQRERDGLTLRMRMEPEGAT